MTGAVLLGLARIALGLFVGVLRALVEAVWPEVMR